MNSPELEQDAAENPDTGESPTGKKPIGPLVGVVIVLLLLVIGACMR
jgi:hypothetical protein